ncbi:MAG: Lactamase protein [Pseudomonadota bacterium]|jgi:hypothetical protein|nr:Lactamase protein [Pseudomonadota bacterium]
MIQSLISSVLLCLAFNVYANEMAFKEASQWTQQKNQPSISVFREFSES